MKYAVISDIHSNLEAFQACLTEIDKRSVDRVVCLGDVIGYGADPEACVELSRELCDLIIAGNHERAVTDLTLRSRFTDYAYKAIEWTEKRISEMDKAWIQTFSPMVIDWKEQITWTHGSVHDPEEFYYMYDIFDARATFKVLETRIAFFGHTHFPYLFSKKGEAKPLAAGIYNLDTNDTYLINPGSIGQPRDKSSKLGFAFFDSDQQQLEIVRLNYDNKRAARKIRKAGLPEFLADRLL